MIKHVLIVGRVCGWDEEVFLPYSVDISSPDWRDKVILLAKAELWEMDGNDDDDDFDEEEIFINGIYISDTPIISI